MMYTVQYLMTVTHRRKLHTCVTFTATPTNPITQTEIGKKIGSFGRPVCLFYLHLYSSGTTEKLKKERARRAQRQNWKKGNKMNKW